MNDRKPLIAIALIMLIAIVPSLFLKKPAPKPGAAVVDSLATPPATAIAQDSGTAAVQPPPAIRAFPGSADTTLPPERTVSVQSKLYRYTVSTYGARIVASEFLHYQSLVPSDTTRGGARDTVQLIKPGDALLGARLVVGGDTVRLDRVAFTASADSLVVGNAPATLTLTGTAGGHDISLSYRFSPDDYRIAVDGHVSGIGTAGATLLIGLGEGLRLTEANPADNLRESGVVTKSDKTRLSRFSGMKPLSKNVYDGPFDWVAVKSKYFVVGMFAYDSVAPNTVTGRIGGLVAVVPDTFKTPVRATTVASLTVPAAGNFQWSMYIGPMEFERLKAAGRDFDDVNPYGWAWLRPVVRPLAVMLRALFVWMHHSLGLGYGLVIVAFGVLMRVVLWPLNSKAYRSMGAMQVIQPQITALQERYKDDPARLQKETLILYRENKVNPLSGCWPMLVPYPLLVAVYFVLASTIEVRGVSFLWLHDLSRADPFYIVPLVMAGSMFLLSKIGQMGVPPNPQAKMMMYMMPVMMLVLFSRFASGLNLYYAVQNLASIPQQWLIMKERKKLTDMKTAAVVIGTKKR